MPTAKRDWRYDAIYDAVAQALAAGQACPTNADLAARIGAGSLSVPSVILRELEQQGRLVVVRTRRGRQVFLPAPGSLPSPADEPCWRGRGTDPLGLRSRRRAIGLSRAALADLAGISDSALTAVELQRPGVSQAVRERVVEVLETAERAHVPGQPAVLRRFVERGRAMPALRHPDHADAAEGAAGPRPLAHLVPPARHLPHSLFVDPPRPERDEVIARLRRVVAAPGPAATCQYMRGEPSARDFCGRPSAPGSSYCGRHHARCHQPPGPPPSPPCEPREPRAPVRLRARRARPAP
ncbi:MAG TPA: hypothetical protein VED40_19700 [Azospirillaceae bacterium]|nr:hypothetical protein [Azospirillaceae bacterium]